MHRHLYLLLDMKGDNDWKQFVHWVDRGQYTAAIKKVTLGKLKNLPPYRDYPYGEESAKTAIVLGIATKAHNTWCRQINPDAPNNIKLMDTPGHESVIIKKQIKDEVEGELLWDSTETLKQEAVRVAPGNYANDDILRASGDNNTCMFGIRNGDAIWSGDNSRWYIDHHVFDSDVTRSMIEFYVLMGDSTNAISIQLGNRNSRGWSLEDTYAFGGYEFIIHNIGEIGSRTEYYYGTNDGIRTVNKFSLAHTVGKLQGTTGEIGLRISFRVVPDKRIVLGDIYEDHDCNGEWKHIVRNEIFSHWNINKDEVPKGRVDSKAIIDGFYGGPFMHWAICRYTTATKDNGSLLNKIKVYKL